MQTSMPAHVLSRAATDAGVFVIVALVLAFGLGLSYGDDLSNQAVYLIDGLRLADPGFLAHDWWAAETTHYHPFFAWLVAALQRLGLMPWGLSVLSIVCLLASMAAVWGMVRALAIHGAVAVALGACGIFYGLYRAHSLGASAFATAGLQPSMIGATLLLVAVWMLFRGRDLASGLWLAAAGAAHVNFAVLCLPLFALAHLLLGRRRLLGRLLRQLLPLTVVVAVQAPFVWTLSGYELPAAVRAEAQAIFFAMVPHHYVPATFLRSFLDPVAWLLLAAPWLHLLGDRDGARRFRALLVAVAAILAVAALLTVPVFVAPVARLFVWRLAPLLILLCQVMVVATPILLARADTIDRPLRRLGVVWIGMLLLLLHGAPAGVPAGSGGAVAFDLLVLAYGLWVARLAWTADARRRARRMLDAGDGRALLGAAACLAVLMAAVGGYDRGRYDLLAATAEAGPSGRLFGWARTTPADSRFLIPLDLQRFRLQAERAVVVDTKAIPLRPDEILEWHRRLTDISPTPDPALPGRFGYATGYTNLTPARVAALAAAYDVDYAVFRKAERPPAVDAPVAYENDGFVVFDVTGLR